MTRPEQGEERTFNATTPACYAASSRRQETASEEIHRAHPVRRGPIQQAVPDGRWGLLTSQWDASPSSSQTLGSRSGPLLCDRKSRQL